MAEAKKHTIRNWYVQFYWFRVALQTIIPILCGLYLLAFTVYLSWAFSGSKNVDPGHLFSFCLGAAVATLGSIFCTSATAQFNDFRIESADRTAEQAQAAMDGWRWSAGLYASLLSVVNELVLDKSEMYLGAVRAGDDNAVRAYRTARDTLYGHNDRIVRVLYGYLQRFADVPAGRSFQVTYFIPSQGRLVLANYCNHSHQPPPTLQGGTNEHLARDGRSLASYVWRTEEMVIIPDTTVELAKPESRFARFGRADEAQIGSIVAYPVVDRALEEFGVPSVLGIICVDCSVKDAFTTEIEGILRFLLDTFAKRIMFEIRRALCQFAELRAPNQ